MSDDRPFCQDCGLRSDLGNKCRACYAKWSRNLYADIPKELERIRMVAVELNKLEQVQRKAVAAKGLHQKFDVQPSGKSIELLKDVWRVLEGPYGPQLEMKLQAVLYAPDESKEKGRKAKPWEVD